MDERQRRRESETVKERQRRQMKGVREQERERESARERELGSLELLHEKGVESGSGSSRVRESLRGGERLWRR